MKIILFDFPKILRLFPVVFLVFAILSVNIGSVSFAQAETYRNWTVICKDPDTRQTCRIEQKLFMNKKVDGKTQNVGKLLSIMVFFTGKQERKPYIVMQLPLGVDLRAGVVLQIDKGNELKAPFSICTNAGCEVQSSLSEEMLEQLKVGNTLKIGFRAYGTTKTIVVDANLMGFTRAFSELK
jgi:invasion protein IalB